MRPCLFELLEEVNKLFSPVFTMLLTGWKESMACIGRERERIKWKI